MAFVVFTFGDHMPFLFFVAALSFFVQYILDKLLLTYWYDLSAQQTDSLNFVFIKILKYAPFSMLMIELVTFNNGMIRIFNNYHEEIFLKLCYILFFTLVGLDLYMKFFEDPAIKFARIYGENKNFLSRLSTLERKRWIL